MAVKIEVPPVGEAVTEGVLSRWVKSNGARVSANEVVAEIETDKANNEVRAPAAGTLVVLVPEGQKVAVGAQIGRIEEGAAPPAGEAKSAKPAAPDGRSAPAGEVLLSPSARQLAADRGVDVSRL